MAAKPKMYTTILICNINNNIYFFFPIVQYIFIIYKKKKYSYLRFMDLVIASQIYFFYPFNILLFKIINYLLQIYNFTILTMSYDI